MFKIMCFLYNNHTCIIDVYIYFTCNTFINVYNFINGTWIEKASYLTNGQNADQCNNYSNLNV